MITSPRFQRGSLTLVKNKTTADAWYLRFYEDVQGKRVYRRRRIGTIREYPHRCDAEKAAHALRGRINSEVSLPDTVGELINHYLKYELGEHSDKRFSTRQAYKVFLERYVRAQWGMLRLNQLKTVAVENWLRSLRFAPGTKSKIKGVMSAVFSHAVRYEMIAANPIRGVRCSSKRLKDPDILTPEEYGALLRMLPQREHVMVLLAGTTGLRRSELVALRWRDIDFEHRQIHVVRSCVQGRIGDTKTKGSAKPVPLHAAVAQALHEWRLITLYRAPDDLLFPSVRKHGSVPASPDMILRKVICPAAELAGITGKQIGWHTFRHSLGTYLRFLGVDIKTAQELLRHANVGVTLNLYTQAVSSQKQEANAKVVELLLPSFVRAGNSQHLSEPKQPEKVTIEAVNYSF